MLKKIFTVGEITEYIKNLIEGGELKNIWIEGEISNFRKAIGNFYFDLKDEKALLRCVMFSPTLSFTPKNGMKVIVKGDIRVYEKRGYYQLYVKDIKIGGIGELFIKFLELKEKLRKEGLFDEKYKKPLPKIPNKIGIVTSPNGAAIKDIQKVLSKRFPVKIVLAPVRVQGEGAAEEIERAIKILNERSDIDLIIVGRGGGSFEDLWAFNEERVARAIFESKIPVISAVGHETDFTIADFVADARAPTPSAAAEMAVPDKREILEWVEGMLKRMERFLGNLLSFYKQRVEGIGKRKAFMYPYEIIYNKILEFEEAMEKFRKQMERLKEMRQKVEKMEMRLKNLSPYKVLERGYSICFRVRDGKLFSSIGDIEIGERIRVVVKDGEAICKVEKK